ncbi:MAG: hypothetical protein RLZZ93_1095 [Actinomycetota bacterium]
MPVSVVHVVHVGERASAVVEALVVNHTARLCQFCARTTRQTARLSVSIGLLGIVRTRIWCGFLLGSVLFALPGSSIQLPVGVVERYGGGPGGGALKGMRSALEARSHGRRTT